MNYNALMAIIKKVTRLLGLFVAMALTFLSSSRLFGGNSSKVSDFESKAKGLLGQNFAPVAHADVPSCSGCTGCGHDGDQGGGESSGSGDGGSDGGSS